MRVWEIKWQPVDSHFVGEPERNLWIEARTPEAAARAARWLACTELRELGARGGPRITSIVAIGSIDGRS